ncbi:AmmeMemoRadiSam system protein A [Heliophilum fasciatum]|uniref:AMMECR1 domain-containing protein n=1 Tax=Heliophilum fasciatum TaxID=35700 RepID=A0A4R2R7Y1_9FIRM|nr:AmmeMemoRadiSam system protein A [Heliophilum fasciatum]MCW2279496.1 AmmeMemoRadiSam system protein A [Heliophilum fasciatum]TCP58733.1 hypothetical protein EDD73_1533 [Heliophilum fasciatum]
MPLVYSVFVPHPPIIVPAIGRGEELACSATLEAYREIANNFIGDKIDTVVIISPHATLLRQGVIIHREDQINGDFASFGAPQLQIAFPAHLELAHELANILPDAFLHSEKVDHGALVPLYFLQEAGWTGKVVIMGMPIETAVYAHNMARLFKSFPERIALVASGDLSHRLKADGPYGFHPAGPQFDQAIVDALTRDPSQIQHVAVELAEEAGECGWRSLQLALAVQESMPRVLSYEGPFGVGYLVAELYRSSPLPHWARLCFETYLKEGNTKRLALPEGPEFQLQRACFVTLKKNGELRGCIGTTEPWRENLAEEIKFNAIAAGTEDPRFWPVQSDELSSITFSVDILGEMEKISTVDELDPWRYGVVVRGRGRTGLLLPHLEGIHTAEEQVKIAKQKAGLSIPEPVELWRFEVVRTLE